MTVIDLFTKVCPDGQFAESIDGQDQIRPDGLHFSKEGTEWLAGWLGPELITLGHRRQPPPGGPTGHP